MRTPAETTHLSKQTIDGLRYARWAGHFLSVLLIGLATKNLAGGSMDTFTTIQSIYFLIYGLVLNVPYGKISDAQWKLAYGALVILSVLFVFLMIASVMFAYMAAAERGEKLGVPGFEGTLIFLALMQVPVVIFQRKPDMLD
ncbi:MAG: hypothetical protein ACSHYA_14220 [Opitutaceae bacterium]